MKLFDPFEVTVNPMQCHAEQWALQAGSAVKKELTGKQAMHVEQIADYQFF